MKPKLTDSSGHFLGSRPEPIDERRAIGEKNAAINNADISFIRGAIGDTPGHQETFVNGPANASGMDIYCVDQLRADHNWPRIDILHADIQGHENRMLQGAEKALSEEAISWLFISTHRWLEDGKKIDLHQTCLDILSAHKYHIVAAHTPEESYTVDGLIVAKAPHIAGMDRISLSARLA